MARLQCHREWVRNTLTVNNRHHHNCTPQARPSIPHCKPQDPLRRHHLASNSNNNKATTSPAYKITQGSRRSNTHIPTTQATRSKASTFSTIIRPQVPTTTLPLTPKDRGLLTWTTISGLEWAGSLSTVAPGPRGMKMAGLIFSMAFSLAVALMLAGDQNGWAWFTM